MLPRQQLIQLKICIVMCFTTVDTIINLHCHVCTTVYIVRNLYCHVCTTVYTVRNLHRHLYYNSWYSMKPTMPHARINIWYSNFKCYPDEFVKTKYHLKKIKIFLNAIGIESPTFNSEVESNYHNTKQRVIAYIFIFNIVSL